MKKQKGAVSIIGGADGPTSVFIAGKMRKTTLKQRIRNRIYQYKRKQIEKKICADAHTLKEVITYANEKYSVIEIDTAQRKYMEQKLSLKESLILNHKPELLGDKNEITKPDYSDEASIRNFLKQIRVRSEMIAQIPDYEMPMDFHIYEIEIEGGQLEMAIDYRWEIFGLSYSGSKKAMKQLRKIAMDLYLYYGVTQEDIQRKSQRYSALVTELSR